MKRIIIFLLLLAFILLINTNKVNNKKIDKTIILSKVEDNKRKIYLTFDDGPSLSITPKVLDILKEEKVKATFFIIHHDEKLKKIIRRERKEGHSIGLHSYSHIFSIIYKNQDNYFKDLKLIENEIYEVIGEKPKIIRFPGGSSNKVSKKYNKGIMTKLVKEVENRGYSYYDWNVSSGDASHKINKSKLYNNVIKNLIYKDNVVLLHDFENNYVMLETLRKIIRYGKENNFIFETIENKKPLIHHRVLN